MRILCINAGSTSLKIERYELVGAEHPIGEPPAPIISESIASDEALPALSRHLALGIDLIAHRIVHLPRSLPAVAPLDAAHLDAIAAQSADAPLHNGPALRLVAIIHGLAATLPQYGVSDSAFHRTLSPAAKTYALPLRITEQGYERIGYHGLSHEYAAHRGCALAGLRLEEARVVSAHLGGGSSLCALAHGRSIDTTMGFTPLDGVPMATRSGSIDPGILLHLLRNGMPVAELEEMLEHHSGLLGISGISGDVRELLATREEAAQLALDILAWRVRAAIGALIATLGGLDLLVFTGGIGEHAPLLRAKMLEGGLGFELALDRAANERSREGRIEAPGGPPVAIVAAREGWQLARYALISITSATS
jgi:acetate kinase